MSPGRADLSSPTTGFFSKEFILEEHFKRKITEEVENKVLNWTNLITAVFGVSTRSRVRSW